MPTEFVHENIELVLYLTGIPTAAMLGVFLLPRFVLRLATGVEPADYIGVFFLRHWGMLTGVVGLMLAAAVSMPELRAPAMMAATCTKASLVVMILVNMSNALGRGLWLVLAFDFACVVLYVLYLLGL